MKRSPIHDLLVSKGAVMGERVGREIPRYFSSVKDEYLAIRGGVGLTDFSSLTRFRIPEDGLEMLENWAAGPVINIRFGRVLHTLALDGDGMAQSDLYIANDDDDFYIIGESLIDDASTAKILSELGGPEAGMEDISNSTALFGVDGFHAWAVAKELFGADVLGLPYLALETYELDGVKIKLIRGGKTSEFGYLLLVPASTAEEVWQKIEAAGKSYGMKPVGLDAQSALRLDGRFFNIFAEGARVKDPLALGLQWMVDFERDNYRGYGALQSRRASGLKKKIIGVVPGQKDGSLNEGDPILHGREIVGEVVCAGDSWALGSRIGLALFDVAFGFSGLTFEGAEGQYIRTVSMPPITAKSLTIKLDEM
jgi:glycine cleavage system aminomethyltransferase T